MGLIRLFEEADDFMEPVNGRTWNRSWVSTIDVGQDKTQLGRILHFVDLQGGRVHYEAKFSHKGIAQFDAPARCNQKNPMRGQGFIASGFSGYRVTSLRWA